MSRWVERCYRLTQREDARWLEGAARLPDDLCLNIEVSYGRGWFLRVPVVMRVFLVLRFGHLGLEPLPDGTLWVPDELHQTVRQSLRGTGVRLQWRTLRRAWFRDAQAQAAWERLL